MDFMNVSNSLPVSYRLAELAEADPPYPAGTLWAEPDIDHAAELMRRAWSEPKLPAQIGDRAKADIREALSSTEVGKLMAARLRRIAQSGLLGKRDNQSSHSQITPVADAGVVSTQHLSPVRFALRQVRLTLARLTPRRLRPAYDRLSRRLGRKFGY